MVVLLLLVVVVLSRAHVLLNVLLLLPAGVAPHELPLWLVLFVVRVAAHLLKECVVVRLTPPLLPTPLLGACLDWLVRLGNHAPPLERPTVLSDHTPIDIVARGRTTYRRGHRRQKRRWRHRLTPRHRSDPSCSYSRGPLHPSGSFIGASSSRSAAPTPPTRYGRRSPRSSNRNGIYSRSALCNRSSFSNQ